MKQLHSHVYYGGQIGLSNARMSVECAMVLGFLTNRKVFLYQKHPLQHSDKFMDDLFDFPENVMVLRRDGIPEEFPAIEQYHHVVHCTRNVPDDFLVGRKQKLISDYRHHEIIRTPDHLTLGFYSNLFYTDESRMRRIYDYLRANLIPKPQYVDIAREAVWNLWGGAKDGFNSVHIRREDKLLQGQPDVSGKFIADRLLVQFDPKERLVIHTDQKDRSYFDPIFDVYEDVIFAEDMYNEYQLDGAESGLVSSLIAGYSKDFIGTLGSTMTSYMQRHRIYEKNREEFKFLYPMFGVPLDENGRMIPLEGANPKAASWSRLNMGSQSEVKSFRNKQEMFQVAFWAREWPEVIPNDLYGPPDEGQVTETVKNQTVIASENLTKINIMTIENAITPDEQADIIKLMMSSKLNYEGGDPHYANSFGLPLMETVRPGNIWDNIFGRMTPEMEKLSGFPLEPSGLYGRVYRNGGILKAHTDRPDLQFTASVCVVAPDPTWPLWVETTDGPVPIDIRPLGAAAMNGTKSKHWRDELKCDDEDMGMYIFFHWKQKEEKRSVLIDENGNENMLFVMDDFLNPKMVERALQLIGQSEFTDSMVQETVDGKVVRHVNAAVRSNKTTLAHTHPQELTEMMKVIELRVNDLLQIEPNRHEPMQVLRYAKGQCFTPHMDCPHNPENDREYTYIIYLTDVVGGGQTRFTNANRTVDAKAGRLAVWKNMRNGVCDQSSMHEGMPVTQGKKIVFVNWIAQKPLK